jgi:Domain of unknown function (DUF4295)
MAKKVVATLKKADPGKAYTKVIKAVRSPKTGAYTFKEEIMLADTVQDYLRK